MFKHRKPGSRIVYSITYKRNGYRIAFFDGNIENIEKFIISSFKLCINPKDYKLKLPYPENNLMKNYEKTTNKKLNSAKISNFVNQFNSIDPEEILSKCKDKTTSIRDLKYLSASRYLRFKERMERLKEEYKANRINIIIDDFYDSLKAKDVTYETQNLNFFIFLIKNTYLKNRSFYVKK